MIVGLGNPGKQFEGTRHNIGYRVVELWGETIGVGLTSRRFRTRYTRVNCEGQNILFVCPTTFMNLSGEPIKAWVSYYKVDMNKLLVIHDDLDLTLGQLKVVNNGGAGGHKGVSSIIKHLRSTDFPRIKIGIGRPRFEETIEDYVLSPFYSDQKKIIEDIVGIGVHAGRMFVSHGVEKTMNHFNCKNLLNKEERS